VPHVARETGLYPGTPAGGSRAPRGVAEMKWTRYAGLHESLLVAIKLPHDAQGSKHGVLEHDADYVEFV
jgi:hypothetical protein